MPTVLLFNPRPNPDLEPVDIPLSLLCISRLLDKDDYKIKIVSENLYENHFDVIKEHASQSIVFGVSSMTGYQIIEGLEASRIVKEANPDIKVVWGGWHPSIYPEQTLENQYIDIVVKGQGERAFYDIVKNIENNKKGFEGISGVHWKEEGKIQSNPDRDLEKLDDLPPIPYHLVDTEKCFVQTEFGERTLNYVSSFGCPHRCGFCCEQTVNKRRWVGLNSKAVLDDLERLEKEFGATGISMYDSNFFVNMKRSKEILQGMLDRGLTVRLGNVDGRTRQMLRADEELWELLRKTRTYSILTGAESGSQEALNLINKDIDVDDNIEFAKKCHQYGIKVIFSSLVGLPVPGLSPDELIVKTDEQIASTINMFDKILSYDNRHRALMFIYGPYPGTPLYEASLSLGFTPPKSLEEWGNYSLYNTHTPWVTEKQAKLVPMISSYIFMLLDSDTIIWLKERIQNKYIRFFFVAAFKTSAFVARIRWKLKFFGFPLDYKMYQWTRKKNKSF